MLIHIIYVSRANSLLPLDLKDILATSRKNNHALGVSGAMCFMDGVYLQCIEGKAAVVDALYQRIESDTRHSVPKILERQPISKRVFFGWSMGLLTWNDETKKVFHSFNPDGKFDIYAADPATIDSLIRAWVAIPNWVTL